MKTRVAVIVLMLMVSVMALSASAARRHSEWWPGERPTPKASGALSGVISQITPVSIAIQANQGTPIFSLTDKTAVRGTKTRVTDLAVGDKAIISYTTLRDGNVWARVITLPKSAQPAKTSNEFGRVVAVTSTAITIATEKKGQLNIALLSSTEVKILGRRSTIDQVKTGVPAIIAYSESAGGQLAKSIRVLAEGVWPNMSGTTQGTITAISPASISLQTPKSSNASYDITTKTKFSIYGKNVAVDQFKLGDQVDMRFNVLDDGTQVASSIYVPIPTLSGKIISISASGFMMTAKLSPIGVTVTPDTKISTHTFDGKLADLAVGDEVHVRGIPANGTLQALSIGFSVPEIKGVVVSASDSTIVVKTVKQKLVNVTDIPTTVILVRPRTAPNYRGTAADVKPGTAVNIGGHLTASNAITALWIDLLVP